MKTTPSLWSPLNTESLMESSSNLMPEFTRLQRQVERLFSDFMGQTPAFNQDRSLTSSASMAPTCDVQETESHYVMSFDLPGLNKEDIKIELSDDVLTVSGERKEEQDRKGRSQYLSERSYGAFERSFSLPAGIKAEQIESNYANGVLQIAVPRLKKTQAQTIKIGEGKPGFWNKLLGTTPSVEGRSEKVA